MKFYIVDCFAEEKYQGNELLVVIPGRPISDEEQQKIAREINFSETTFILSDKKQNGGYDVRIWTPNVGEVPFAGHPTLGTAAVIRNVIECGSNDVIKLNLKAGQIPVFASEHGQTMLQNEPKFGTVIESKEISEIYGISEQDILNEYPIQWVSTGLEAVIVPLKSREALSKLSCNKELFFKYIERHPECNCNHLFFVKTGENVLQARCLMEDFVEDPATGSANGDLAGYVIKHNFFGKADVEYSVYQGYDMGRPSCLQIQATLKDNNWRIAVGGNCYIVAKGEWE